MNSGRGKRIWFCCLFPQLRVTNNSAIFLPQLLSSRTTDTSHHSQLQVQPYQAKGLFQLFLQSEGTHSHLLTEGLLRGLVWLVCWGAWNGSRTPRGLDKCSFTDPSHSINTQVSTLMDVCCFYITTGHLRGGNQLRNWCCFSQLTNFKLLMLRN